MSLDSTILSALVGQSVAKAESSLTRFSIEFKNGDGLIAEAVGGVPDISLSIVEKNALPRLADAVCAVDWSWITGSTIKAVSFTNGRLKLELDPAGPLTVSAGMWQGSPFLAFQPFAPPGAR